MRKLNSHRPIRCLTLLAATLLGAFLRAAREMQEHGTFTFADEAVGYRDISAMFKA